jgi:hypothetical protein
MPENPPSVQAPPYRYKAARPPTHAKGFLVSITHSSVIAARAATTVVGEPVLQPYHHGCCISRKRHPVVDHNDESVEQRCDHSLNRPHSKYDERISSGRLAHILMLNVAEIGIQVTSGTQSSVGC